MVTQHELDARLARMEERLTHIDRSLAGPPTMAERVTVLEERVRTVMGLPKQVADGKQHDAVADAITGERARARTELRKNIGVIAAISSIISIILPAALRAAGVL